MNGQLELLPPAKPATPSVAAFCPKCGGWTMFHGNANGDTATQWIKMSYVLGDLILIVTMPSQLTWSWLDSPCPQSDALLDDRTCCEPADRGIDE